MKNFKFLTGMLFIQLLGHGVFAQTAVAPSAGDGTAFNPYQISTLSNLYWLSQTTDEWAAGKYFIQTANIDAAETTAWFSDGNGGYAGFPSIGGVSKEGNGRNGDFNGNYDGQGFSISGLYMNHGGHYIGLFGYLGTAVKSIRNLRLINPAITASGTGNLQYIGILIGRITGNTTVQNVHIENGSLKIPNTSNAWFVGGMVGDVYDKCRFINSTVNANVQTLGGIMHGGFVGRVWGGGEEFRDCSASGTLLSGGNRVGGFIGQTEHSVDEVNFRRCFSSVSISNTIGNTGGFVGLIFGKVFFNDCYSSGNMSSISGIYHGGFYGVTWSMNNVIEFNRCYTTTAIQGGSWKGGFGSSDYAQPTVTYSSSFWNTSTSGIASGLNGENRTGLSGASDGEFKSSATFTDAGYDFLNESANGSNDYWAFTTGENNGYPTLLHNVRIWTGGANTTWNNAANWQNDLLPNASSIVRFVNSPAYLPNISTDITADVLDLSNTTGIVELNGYNLSVNEVIGYNASKYIRPTGSGSLRINIPADQTAIFPVGNSSYNPVAIKNRTGSVDLFSASVIDEVYQDGSSSGNTVAAGRVARTWNIGKTNPNAGDGIDFRFNWNNGETAGNLTSPALYHYEGNWSAQTNGTTSSTTASLDYIGYTGTFSPFAIMNFSTLPVTWLSFTGEKEREQVALKWSTAEETGADNYLVQHSTDAGNWQTIGQRKSAGNSSSVQLYSFIHTTPSKGNNYYRLLQNDLDGRQEYSKTIVVTFAEGKAAITLFPNPLSGSILTIKATSNIRAEIFNASGTKVMELQVKEGSQPVDVSRLGTGMYFFKAGDQTISFVKQ